MKYLIHTIFVFLLIPGTLLSQIDRTQAPEPGPAPVIQIGDYKTFELKNGLKVFLIENHKIPRVSYSLVLDIKPFAEGDSLGYTSIAGELLGTATTTRTKDQIDEEIDFIGASLSTSSGSVNGSVLKKHNDKLLEIMSDILLNPVFNQAELDKVKKQTISALAYNKNDPAAISETLSDALFYGKDHPYGEVTTEATVNSVTVKMCEDYYGTYFKPNIAYLAIVGDMKLKEAKKLAKKYFGEWIPGEVPSKQYSTPEAPASLQVSIVDRPVAVQSVIVVGYPVEYTLGTDDYIKARVMNVLLGGSNNRLFQNLREDHGYTYGAYSSLSQDKFIGSFNAGADVRNEVTDSAVTQILYEMERIRNEPVPLEELEKVKNYLTGTFALALEQPSTVARFALNIARYGLPADYYANYLKSLAAVTPEDITEMAKKYIKPENCHVFIVGKADDVSENLAALSPDQTINYYDVEGNYIDPASLKKALPAGLTAEKVVENYLAAIGGREKLEALKDVEITMKMNMQGMTIDAKMYQKAPDKYKMTISMGESVLSDTRFDGKVGRMSGMQGEQVLEGKQLENLQAQSQFMRELKYDDLGYSLQLKGIEIVNGNETYMVEVSHPGSGTGYDYYDIETGLRLREDKIEVTPDGEMIQTTHLSDYKDVEGILYPHKLDVSVGPQQISATIDVIKLNTGVDDSEFQ
jgi:predicted Zn-dependent peptidase/outer membrane lipoprotein-sorting protein